MSRWYRPNFGTGVPGGHPPQHYGPGWSRNDDKPTVGEDPAGVAKAAWLNARNADKSPTSLAPGISDMSTPDIVLKLAAVTAERDALRSVLREAAEALKAISASLLANKPKTS